MLMSPTLRYVLIFLAAATAALAAADPIGVPPLVQALIGAAAAGFAGLGVLPPSWTVVNDAGTRAIKRDSNERKIEKNPNTEVVGRRRIDDQVGANSKRSMLSRLVGIAAGVALTSSAILGISAIAPVTASVPIVSQLAAQDAQAYLNVSNARNHCHWLAFNDAVARGTGAGPTYGGHYRNGPRDVNVRLSYSNGYSYVTVYDCRFIGDSNPSTGGVTNISYQHALAFWGSFDVYGNPNWPCAYYYCPVT